MASSSLHLLSRLVFFLIVLCGYAVCGGTEEHDSSDSPPAERAPAR